jgi:hypothetical protein
MNSKKRELSELSKLCQSCGRAFEWRKKWSRHWVEVKYCSDECRKNKQKYDYSQQILDLLLQRKPQSTICPSEVLEGEQKQDKILMEHVRRSARRLAHEEKIDITHQGKVVDPCNFKGLIRLRLKRKE